MQVCVFDAASGMHCGSSRTTTTGVCLWRCLRYALWVIENHNYRCVSLTLPQVRTVGHREPQLQVCVWRCLRYALWVIENHNYRCVSLTLPQVRTVGDREPQLQVCVSDAASGTHCGWSRTTTTGVCLWRCLRYALWVIENHNYRCVSLTLPQVRSLGDREP